MEYAYRVLEEGTSADRQLAIYHETGDVKAVVDLLIRETAEGVLDAAPVSASGTPHASAGSGGETPPAL